jgi:hypothetical protein
MDSVEFKESINQICLDFQKSLEDAAEKFCAWFDFEKEEIKCAEK